MNDLTHQLESELAKAIDGNTAEAELVRNANVHRRCITKYSQRIADTIRNREATLASIEERMELERKRHRQALAEMSEQLAQENLRSGRQIEADKRLLASAESALAALEPDE